MPRGRPNRSERLLLDYVSSKPDRVLDRELDKRPFARYVEVHDPAGPPVSFYATVDRLRRRNVLHVLQRGRYVLTRDRAPARSPRLDDLDPVADAVLRRLGHDYYVSWHSALWYHGLLDQQSRRIYVAVRGKKRDVQIGLATVRFVLTTERKFFGWERADDFEWPVNVATVEKALIDSLDRPQLAAPVPVVASAMRAAWRSGSLDPERLVDLTVRFRSPTVARRVGFFMDLYEIPGSDPLTLHLGRKYAVPLTPGDEPRGSTVPVNSRWRVFEHPDVIAAALELK
jgi:predicted transcriptional regulator of viral defense system